MKNQIYDGRIKDEATGKMLGWTLRAGDTIRYWASCQNMPTHNLIETKIIKLRDKYGTERLKGNVPIDVEAEGNPPFWSTDIKKLPPVDPENPLYFPLSQCKLIPGQIENALEKEALEMRSQFNQELTEKGWGGMLYHHNNEANSHNAKRRTNHEDRQPPRDAVALLMAGRRPNLSKSSGSKRKSKAKGTKRKRRKIADPDPPLAVDGENTTDTDIEVLHPPNVPNEPKPILSSNDHDNQRAQRQHSIVNGDCSMTFAIGRNRKRKGTKKRKRPGDDAMRDQEAAPTTKKRKLYNPKTAMLYALVDGDGSSNVTTTTTTTTT